MGDDAMFHLDHVMDGACLMGLVLAPVYLLYKIGCFCLA